LPIHEWTPIRYPVVDSGSQGRFNRATAALGISGREMRLSVPSLGETRIACLRVGPALRPQKGALCWRIRDSHRRGWLVMDSLSCLAVVSATLGLDPPRIARLPTRIEAGIVAASLAAVVRAADQHLMLDLDDEGWEDDELVALELRLTCKSFDARMLAQIPVEWIPRCTDAVLAAAAVRRRLTVSLALETARTTLTIADWSRAVAGDAVVFDGFAVPPVTGPWSLRVRCGDHVAEASWNDAGELRLSSELVPDEGAAPRAAGRAIAPDETDGRKGIPAMSDDERMAKFSVLAAAPLEVIAEVGELVLRADEVMALQCGSVIPLERLHTRLVELKIAGKVWARGELVEVDGAMAVRLTELVTPADRVPAESSATPP
jgi:flagellar motor switch/type III secretory pathway protein FliN